MGPADGLRGGAAVGHDLVDLTRPRTRDRAGDVRLLRRVLTEAERARVAGADPEAADRVLWAFWAAKEAAFKVHTQLLGSPPTFVHADYRVHGAPPHEPGSHGIVLVAWEGGGCRVAVTQQRETVQAVAAGDGDPLDPGTEPVPEPSQPPMERPGVVPPSDSGFRLPTPSLPPGHLLVAETVPTNDAVTRWGHDEAKLRPLFTDAEWDAVHAPASAWARLGVRRLASVLLEIAEGELAVVCAPGVAGRRPPHLEHRGSRHPASVSFTHDGSHLGWSVLVPPSPPMSSTPG